MVGTGYVFCACRDCFEIAIIVNDTTPTMCNFCKKVGCTPWSDENDGDCQREGAYGGSASD
jgi:hypothetical protein